MRGIQFDEREPAAHGCVDPGDRPVGGVHRADQEQVLRERELLVRGVLQADGLVAVLQQEVQLAEHLGQVRAVDLVDDQDVGRGGLAAATSAKSRNGPARSVKVKVPLPPGSGRKPSKKSS